MTVIFPEGVTVQGNVGLFWVPVIAVSTAPKLATEINAAASLNISCFVMGGSWSPGAEQSKGEAPPRLCSKVTFDRLGNTKYTLQDLVVSVDPQGATGSDGVKAYEKMTAGLAGYVVERLGLDARLSAWAVGQFVNVWPVTLGVRMPITGDTSDEYAEFTYAQSLVVRTPGPSERVAVVA